MVQANECSPRQAAGNHLIEMSLVKKWLITVRAFSYTASFTSVFLGMALALYDGHPAHWGLCVLTLVGVVCFHTTANLLNDCVDHRRGLDTQVVPTSGGVVRGWISERTAFRAAMGFLTIGVVCGLFLTWQAGWVVMLLGGIGTLIALGYTRNGFCFKYAGLGDLAIFIAFGVLPTFGSYWVQARHFSWLPIVWSIPIAAFTVGILHANNWRDLTTDPAQGCRTFASLLGERGSAVYYRVLMIGPFVMTLALCALAYIPGAPTGGAPLTCVIVLLAVPLAVKLLRIDRAHDARTFVMLDGKTAQLQLLFGILLPSAFIVSRWLPQ